MTPLHMASLQISSTSKSKVLQPTVSIISLVNGRLAYPLWVPSVVGVPHYTSPLPKPSITRRFYLTNFPQDFGFQWLSMRPQNYSVLCIEATHQVKVQNVLGLLWSIHFEKKIRVDHHVILYFLVKIYLISRTKDIIIIFFLYSLVAQESNSTFLVILFERRKVLSQSSITLRNHH